MSDDKPESSVKSTIDAVTGLAKAVPVYGDAIQPAAREVGKSLETVAKLVNMALAPVSALVWGFDQIRDFVSTRVAEKLKDIPEERIKSPSPAVAGPTLEALKYTGHEETLRELYANLLATSLDSYTARDAHPAFVEIIKNLSPDEARIIRLFTVKESYPLINLHAQYKEAKKGYTVIEKHFSHIGKEAGCDHPALTPNYLSNLCRLGLTEIPEGTYLVSEGIYDNLKNDPRITSQIEKIDKSENQVAEIEEAVIILTRLGFQFVYACVIEKSNKANSADAKSRAAD